MTIYEHVLKQNKKLLREIELLKKAIILERELRVTTDGDSIREINAEITKIENKIKELENE